MSLLPPCPLSHLPLSCPTPSSVLPLPTCPTPAPALMLTYRLLTYKPKGCKVGVELRTMDVETLDPGEYLNDKIMDFYLK